MTEEFPDAMPKLTYHVLCSGIDNAVGSTDCAEPILSYLLGRVVGRDTPPGLEAGRLLLDDLAEDKQYADALMAVWGMIKENIKAT